MESRRQRHTSSAAPIPASTIPPGSGAAKSACTNRTSQRERGGHLDPRLASISRNWIVLNVIPLPRKSRMASVGT